MRRAVLGSSSPESGRCPAGIADTRALKDILKQRVVL
jgi:hypothetical protein